MPAGWSSWLVRLRVLGVLPHAAARLSAGGAPLLGAGVAITDSAVPELDISYFFTTNIAAELILGVTRHGVQGAGSLAGPRIGSTCILPPTLTLQYHFAGLNPLKPYVGAGVNYSIFFGEEEGGEFTGFRLSNSVAPALQVGFDYMLDAHWGVNVDVKKLFLDTKVKLDAGAIRGRVDIDPWIVGAGLTQKFFEVPSTGRASRDPPHRSGSSSSLVDPAARRKRRRSKSSLARPYMLRLKSLSRSICPSACPLLQGRRRPARTAAPS